MTEGMDARLEPRVRETLEKAVAGGGTGREECEHLLSFAEDSLEAGTTRVVADQVSRRRFGNQALLLGQIGVDMAPCEGGCAFCFFATPHTTVTASTLPLEEAAERARAFARGGVQGIFLMTMHRFGFQWFLDLVAGIRQVIPSCTQLLANVGDLDEGQLCELRGAGLTDAYHVCRLREGIDTRIPPRRRIQTIERIVASGLDWYTSCEPIGPEHTPEELVDRVFLGLELGCVQHAAMRRFPVPGSPLFGRGQVSLERLAQIVAVIALAAASSRSLRSVAVHESNLAGLRSGANALYPEAGEPKPMPDACLAEDDPSAAEGFTSALWRRSHEISTADCRLMLVEAGFDRLVLGDGTAARLLADGSLAAPGLVA